MQIIYGILGLGLVVLIHEAGHLFAARMVGIEVEVFSIGWGKKLIGFTRGRTEYRISIFPLGGFAKMKGEATYRQAIEEGLDRINPEPNSFFAASPAQRIFVASAGPLMNFLFAVIVFSIINLFGFSYLSYSNRIVLVDDFPDYYQQSDTLLPATEAGLQTGDRILEVNGIQTQNFSELQQEIGTRALETVDLIVERNGQMLGYQAELELDENSGSGILGIFPYIEPIIDGPFAEAEEFFQSFGAQGERLMPEDRIIAINNVPVSQAYEVQAVIDSLPIQAEQIYVSILLDRNGEELIIEHPLYLNEGSLSLGYTYLLGAYNRSSSNILQAILMGLEESFQTLASTVKGLGLLFRGLNPQSALSGPIRITAILGEVTARGLEVGILEGIRSFFHLLGILSIALFFGNLLPIPILDGGQILMSLIEAIKKSPISPKIFIRYQSTGVVIVFALLIFVIFSDIVFLVNGSPLP